MKWNKVVYNVPGLVQDTETAGWRYATKRVRETSTVLSDAGEWARQFIGQGSSRMWVSIRDGDTNKLISIAAPKPDGKWCTEEVLG